MNRLLTIALFTFLALNLAPAKALADSPEQIIAQKQAHAAALREYSAKRVQYLQNAKGYNLESTKAAAGSEYNVLSPAAGDKPATSTAAKAPDTAKTEAPAPQPATAPTTAKTPAAAPNSQMEVSPAAPAKNGGVI